MMASDINPMAAFVPFLDRAGWIDASISPLAGDASFRRYFRIACADGRKAMLMHAPPPYEDPKPFLDITRYLINNRFRAPEIYADDIDTGLLLLEDFGDCRMREHLDENPSEEHGIYGQAVDTLVSLGNAPVADVAP
jgi:N-acetylmuramate 1-kinase